MEYRIIERGAFEIIEKVEVHTTENGQNLKTVPAFWDRAHADGTVQRLIGMASDDTYVYGVCYDNANPEEKSFEYSIAVESNLEAAPEGFRKTLIPARTWAAFACKGAVSHSIFDTWQKIFTEFFPKSEYRSLRELDLEVYPGGDADSEEYYCEIWIPVEKKETIR